MRIKVPRVSKRLRSPWVSRSADTRQSAQEGRGAKLPAQCCRPQPEAESPSSYRCPSSSSDHVVFRSAARRNSVGSSREQWNFAPILTSARGMPSCWKPPNPQQADAAPNSASALKRTAPSRQWPSVAGCAVARRLVLQRAPPVLRKPTCQPSGFRELP